MNFDEIQQVWGRQDAGGCVTIHADLLLKEVRHNQRKFESTIFWRDFRESGVAMCLVYLFGRAWVQQDDWTYGLLALACFGVGLFILVDRLRQRRRRPVMEDSLRGCLLTSLDQVRHQIWLLRNVFWWYQLPLLIPLFISILHEYVFVQAVLVQGFVMALLNWGIYWLNQAAVRKTLEPRERELEALLCSLDDVQVTKEAEPRK
jgi:hypothetical protein